MSLASEQALHQARLFEIDEAQGALLTEEACNHVGVGLGHVGALEVDGDDAVAPRAVVLRHGGLLDHAVARCEHEEVVLGEVAAGDDGRGMLALCEREHVDNGRAARLAATDGQLDADRLDGTVLQSDAAKVQLNRGIYTALQQQLFCK